MLCFLLILVWSRVTICRVAVRDRGLWSSRSLQMCVDYDPCGAVGLIVSLTFSEADVLHVNWTRVAHCFELYVPMVSDAVSNEGNKEVKCKDHKIELSVIGTTKVSRFEIMCHVLGRIPIVGTFHHFYVNSIRNGWLSFLNRGGADNPCCYSKKFDSLKNWNNRFFWIDASVCPLSTSWFSGTSVVKDPLSVDEAVDLPCVELLNENRTLIRKYPKTFLCLVGLSRSFIETDVRPTLLHDNDEDELNVNSGKRKKRVAFVFGSPPVKKARTEGIGEQVVVGFGSAAPVTEDVTSSSVTPTPEHALEDALHDNAGVSVHVTEFTGDGHSLFAPELETGICPLHRASVPQLMISMNNPVICCSFLDRVAPPGYWAALCNQESEAAEVEDLCKRVSDLEAMITVKVGEAASLTTQNAGLLEKVSALELECDGLKGQVVGESKMREEFVSQQDAAERRFTEHAAALDACIADVRRDMDNELYPQILTAIVGRRWVVGHGFCLPVYKCARSVECCSALGKVISMAINKGIQQGLEAGFVHGTASRSLAQIEAYDPEVEGKYVAAVFEFKGVSFSLLDELESLKDSPHALIMSALILKDDQGNMDATPEFSRFQPLSIKLPSALGGTSGPAPSHDSSLGVTDYQVSTLVLSGDEGPTNPSPVVQSHDDLFDTSVLVKSGDV
nr:putative transposase (putative), gypsy type [Tanacetum cinerariifolium]